MRVEGRAARSGRSKEAEFRHIARAQRQGQAISFADGQIAAVAETKGFMVATRDVEPFAAAGLRVVDPWSA